MKKHLLTSTALVAAGVMAVSGPPWQDRNYRSEGRHETAYRCWRKLGRFRSSSMEPQPRSDQRVGFDQQTDGEIHFVGSVTLDNGIKIKTNVQLEANSAAR